MVPGEEMFPGEVCFQKLLRGPARLLNSEQLTNNLKLGTRRFPLGMVHGSRQGKEDIILYCWIFIEFQFLQHDGEY